jgi:hypothetical protein
VNIKKVGMKTKLLLSLFLITLISGCEKSEDIIINDLDGTIWEDTKYFEDIETEITIRIIFRKVEAIVSASAVYDGIKSEAEMGTYLYKYSPPVVLFFTKDGDIWEAIITGDRMEVLDGDRVVVFERKRL